MIRATAGNGPVGQPLGLPERLLLIAAGALSIGVGALLYLLPDRTEQYFAWTIANPLTAVYMGASYLAGAGTFDALRLNRWSAARVLFPFMIIFGTMQLLATLLHVPSFHWDRPITWAWAAVYAVSGVLAAILYVRNERRYWSVEGVRAAGRRIPPLLALVGLLHSLVGLALFLAPEAMATVWPWGLTPLTSRVIAGWYLAGAVALWARSRQATPAVGQVGQIAGFVAAPLLLLGLVRFPDALTGPSWALWLYVLDVVIVGALLVYGQLRARRRA